MRDQAVATLEGKILRAILTEDSAAGGRRRDSRGRRKGDEASLSPRDCRLSGSRQVALSVPLLSIFFGSTDLYETYGKDMN